ncbi:MAG TPA: ATP-binding protein [Longimicrobium sp.]
MAIPSSRSARAAPRPVRLGGSVSLEWKLPLLMTAFLAAGLAVMIVLTWRTVSMRAEAIVRDRLNHAVREVAKGAEASLSQRAAMLRGAAADAAVRRALMASQDGGAAAPEIAAARAVLTGLDGGRDPAPAELWDLTGRVVARLEGDSSTAAERAALLRADGPGAGVRFGPQHLDGRRVRFWAYAPVAGDGGARVGWLAQERGIGGPRDAMRMLREFMREDVHLYTRNADGSLWSVHPGVPVAAPVRRDSAGESLWHERAGGERFLAAEARIEGTPWVMVMESPAAWVVARPKRTVLMLARMGLVLAALGGLLAWLVSRRITRPLATLTAASEAVAAGRYDRRVSGAGRDEVGRLAASFDAMARQVESARRALEEQVEEATAAAEGLEEANAELRQARDDAERARAEAEQASRAKGDFLAVMSHELRTPLNAIGGYAQLIEMGIHGPVTDAQREALERIARSQAHLLTLINQVLSYARVDARQVQYVVSDVPVAEMLAEVESLVAPQVAASGVAFHRDAAEPALAVRADADKVRQVLLNLLGNAVKYTPPGGTVALECEADEREVRIRVRDTGTGIRAERLPHIFEPFVQGERALNRPDEGVGLGLAISRELARGMGGELSVWSEPGTGSAFTFTLPRGVLTIPVHGIGIGGPVTVSS